MILRFKPLSERLKTDENTSVGFLLLSCIFWRVSKTTVDSCSGEVELRYLFQHELL